MANSRYEYVKQFEKENYLLPDCYILIRVDGRGFHKFSAEYEFAKPNDIRALNVMNDAAKALMADIPDISMAYGDSDEYSFLLRKSCELFERREAKLITTFSSTFTAYYTHFWSVHFPDAPLRISRLPTFDARAVIYPASKHIRDYFSWRQADCHINNLYNTTFWTLVEKGGLSPKESENRLIGTLAKDKNEILFKEFNINYNNEADIFKKGSTIVRDFPDDHREIEDPRDLSDRQKQREEKKRRKAIITVHHVDVIGDAFWNTRPWILQ